MVRRIAERQNRHRRAAPEEYLVGGEHCAVCRGRGAVESLRGRPDRRSVSGGVIMCGGASVCRFSRTQKCVTLSTSEVEYVALGDAVKELLFLRQIWRFMSPSKVMPCFPFLKAIKVLYNLRRTRSRTQIRSTLTYVIIFFDNLSARGTLW